jgi:6-phosphogluconolactonase
MKMNKCNKKEIKRMSKFRGFIGTYTKGDSKGIYSFTLDNENSKILDVKLVAELENPTYLTVNHDSSYIYSVAKKGEAGGVAAYSLNSQTGDVSFQNSLLETGASPCHISVNRDNNYVVTANYHKGTVDLYSIDQNNGKVEALISTIQHTGSGPNKERQEKPHVHYSGFTPDEKYIAVIDLEYI